MKSKEERRKGFFCLPFLNWFIECLGRVHCEQASALAELIDHSVTAMDMLPDARSALQLNQTALTSTLSPIYGRPPDAVPQSAAVASSGLKA